ncbi:MAG: Ig-like domain-containing protein [Muribaculaceae bacterium]|nr:Ig-like domain-containing protein [Muribaculaceae bacterium]
MKKLLLTLVALLGAISMIQAASWVKVTSTDELDFSGNTEYIIVYGTTAAMGYDIGSNSYFPKVDLQKTNLNGDEILTLPDGIAFVKLEGSAATAKLNVCDGDGVSKGYYNTTVKNKCSLVTSGGTNATVKIEDGNFIANFGDSYGTLQYNSSSPRFVNYTSAQGKVQIYKTKIEDNKTPVNLSFDEESYNVSLYDEFDAPTVNCDVEAARSEIVYSSSNEDVATVDKDGKVTLVGFGATDIKAEIKNSETYSTTAAFYTLNVYDPSLISLVFSDHYSSNGNIGSHTIGDVTFEFGLGKNANNNRPVYNAGDKGARIYGGNTITITAAEGYVLKYAQFLDKTDKEVSFIDGVTATRGTLTGGKWTAANRFVTSFVLTNGGTSGNTKVDHINVSVVALDDLELEEYNFADFKDSEIQTNEEITFNLPDYAPEITFTSSDEDVAIVEEGKIVPVAPGETTITASWEDGNGWKAGTKEFKVTVISALQDPVFELVGDSYITVSEEDDLTIEFKYEGVENPQFTITSSRPEYATATVDATNKTITVDIIKRGTTEFTLSVAGNDEFDKATLKFTVKVCYKDLASILENAKEGETYTGVFPVTLVYENDSYNYVTDGTAWALFYVDRNEVENHTHGNGAVIPAGWTAKYTVYNGLPEFTEIEHEAEVTETEVVKITEYSNVTLTSDMVNQVVMLLDVEFTEATPSAKPSSYSDNFEGYFNGVDYTFRNAFGVDGVEAGVYNLKAVVNVYNRNVQIYPIEYRKQTETTTAPVVTEKTYAHGEVIEFTGLEEGAHIYYRHGGEDPDHNNVFTGSASNSPMKAAVNTTWTYNHTTHPLTFSDGQEMIVKFMAKKPGKVASEVKSVGINANGEATTGLENIAVEEAEAVYYNLQGVRVENPAAGVYVRVAGGKATKVMFK